MLEQLGYSLAVQSNGQEALETFQKNPQAFDLIITDQTMPKMLGTALTNKIRQIRSDMPIILCSGYSDLVTESTAAKFGIDAFLKKPFNIMELGKTVEKALGRITRTQSPAFH